MSLSEEQKEDIKNQRNNFYKTRNEVDQNTYIVKHTDNNDLQRCETIGLKCEKIILDNIDTFEWKCLEACEDKIWRYFL